MEDTAPRNRFNRTGTFLRYAHHCLFSNPVCRKKIIGSFFYFRVNGVDVYAKGSNMIPADVFSARATMTTWEWLLDSAVASHQNMVRHVGAAALPALGLGFRVQGSGSKV